MKSKLIIVTFLLAAILAPLAWSQDRPNRQPATSPASGLKTLRDVEYAKADGKPLLLDLYLPAKAPDKPQPLIIWIHGGGWQGGSKRGCPAIPGVARGYVVASVEYRMSQVATFPAQIHDCKAAVRFLRANAAKYNIDPDRFGAWGGSAGGHLVALLGTSGGVKELEGDLGNNNVSSRVQAVCDWFGPTDLRAIVQVSNTAAAGPVGKLLGGNMELAALASPITHITKDAPPFLIMHGDKDPLVPLRQSQTFHDALKKAGVDSTYYVVQGAGHGFRGTAQLKMVAEFFDKHLMAKPGSP